MATAFRTCIVIYNTLTQCHLSRVEQCWNEEEEGEEVEEETTYQHHNQSEYEVISTSDWTTVDTCGSGCILDKGK